LKFIILLIFMRTRKGWPGVRLYAVPTCLNDVPNYHDYPEAGLWRRVRYPDWEHAAARHFIFSPQWKWNLRFALVQCSVTDNAIHSSSSKTKHGDRFEIAWLWFLSKLFYLELQLHLLRLNTEDVQSISVAGSIILVSSTHNYVYRCRHRLPPTSTLLPSLYKLYFHRHSPRPFQLHHISSRLPFASLSPKLDQRNAIHCYKMLVWNRYQYVPAGLLYNNAYKTLFV